MALIMNPNNNCSNWPDNNITVEKVLAKNSHIEDGSLSLWQQAKSMLTDCESKGFIQNK